MPKIPDWLVPLIPIFAILLVTIAVKVQEAYEKYEILRKSVAELKRRSDDAGDFRRALLEEAADTLREIRESRFR